MCPSAPQAGKCDTWPARMPLHVSFGGGRPRAKRQRSSRKWSENSELWVSWLFGLLSALRIGMWRLSSGSHVQWTQSKSHVASVRTAALFFESCRPLCCSKEVPCELDQGGDSFKFDAKLIPDFLCHFVSVSPVDNYNYKPSI